MPLRILILIFAMWFLALSSPAHAGLGYIVLPDPFSRAQLYVPIELAFALLVIGLVYFLHSIGLFSSYAEESESAEDVTLRIENEAAILRARKRKTDAETELRASLIDKARLDAEFKEINQIIEHDKRVRSISRNGRSSL